MLWIFTGMCLGSSHDVCDGNFTEVFVNASSAPIPNFSYSLGFKCLNGTGGLLAMRTVRDQCPASYPGVLIVAINLTVTLILFSGKLFLEYLHQSKINTFWRENLEIPSITVVVDPPAD